MANIIIKKKSRIRRYAQPNEHLGSYDPRVKKQYSKVSKENKETFRQEKTVQELTRKGFNEAAISGMMKIDEKPVRKMMKRAGKNIILDGKY